MDSNTLIWVGAVAVVAGALNQALKAGNVPIKPRYLPWVSLGVGIVAGVTSALAAGKTWQESLMVVVAGLLPVGVHELGTDRAKESPPEP